MLAELLERWTLLESDRCLPWSGLQKSNMNWLHLPDGNKMVRVFNHGNDPQSLAVVEHAVQQAIAARPDWIAFHHLSRLTSDGSAEHVITVYPKEDEANHYSASSAIAAEAWLEAYLKAVEGVKAVSAEVQS
ncbi:hypothetical protein NDA01_21765 [Trichocoleus desertorum AS-A10]|uniref:hypothetical protein n=1 Tax=Trichocoleus desertorum TaxID=1481672 RepID=UPI003297D70D